jgi:flavorubredoxin
MDRLEKGTTYNSYLIFGDKTALVDASHEKFHELYLETLDKELKKMGKKCLLAVQIFHPAVEHNLKISLNLSEATVVIAIFPHSWFQNLGTRWTCST